jgi:hypothetical protein
MRMMSSAAGFVMASSACHRWSIALLLCGVLAVCAWQVAALPGALSPEQLMMRQAAEVHVKGRMQEAGEKQTLNYYPPIRRASLTTSSLIIQKPCTRSCFCGKGHMTAPPLLHSLGSCTAKRSVQTKRHLCWSVLLRAIGWRTSLWGNARL